MLLYAAFNSIDQNAVHDGFSHKIASGHFSR